jgi:hypothetical protein
MNPDKSKLGGTIKPPDNPGEWIGKTWRGKLCAMLTCLLNPRYTVAVTDANGYTTYQDASVEMAPNGMTVCFPPITAASSVTADTVPFAGAGAPAAGTLSSSFSYVAGTTPSLYVDTTNNLLYRCSTAGTNSTSVWTQIGGGSSSTSIQQFKFKSDGGDYWVCRTWDGSSEGGSDVKVAKPYKLRCGTGKIGSEVIAGITYTYTYTADAGTYKRTVSGSDGSAEDDYLIPRMLADNLIYGITFATTSPASLSAVVWLDINADGRAWGSSS